MSQFDWPEGKQKLRLWRLPQDKRFYIGSAHLQPTYIGEKGRTLGKTYGIKVRCYQEHPWGTYLEPIGNLKGTC